MRGHGSTVRRCGRRPSDVSVVWATGCISAAPAEPSGFSVEYETGSIPPPFNHAYVLVATFTNGAMDVTYELSYRYRGGDYAG